MVDRVLASSWGRGISVVATTALLACSNTTVIFVEGDAGHSVSAANDGAADSSDVISATRPEAGAADAGDATDAFAVDVGTDSAHVTCNGETPDAHASSDVCEAAESTACPACDPYGFRCTGGDFPKRFFPSDGLLIGGVFCTSFPGCVRNAAADPSCPVGKTNGYSCTIGTSAGQWPSADCAMFGSDLCCP